jgi:hypothetical protein
VNVEFMRGFFNYTIIVLVIVHCLGYTWYAQHVFFHCIFSVMIAGISSSSIQYSYGSVLSFYVHKNSFVRVNEGSEITQFLVTITMNCQVLTHRMNVSSAVGHKWAICCFNVSCVFCE